ncbi:MAG: DoxX family protein [Hyphomicrobiaceae bacterium]
MTNTLDKVSPYVLSVLRVMSGLLLLQHGTIKFLSIPVGPMNNTDPTSLSGIAGMIELVCGPLLILGLFTRPVAFLASGLTAFAYFLAHAPRGFYPILNGGELAVLYSFVFLYLAAAGGGALSLDRLFRRSE